MLKALRAWLRRRRYREGRTLSEMVAFDVRRDIQILSAERLDEGVIVGRVRTVNVLYLAHGLQDEPLFGPPTELRLDQLWHWEGQPWGGLPDGTSLAQQLLDASEPESDD